MTDGIIQEVFKRYRDIPLQKYFPYDHRSILDLLQKELIERIKQEFNDDTDPYYGELTYNWRRKLIGDNQE